MRRAGPGPVKRIGSGANKVEISPPATINCAMVVSLHAWVEKTLQPAAQEALGSPVTRLRNASGYACRNRIGSQFHADRLSEHALANAIDIAGFVTADGRTVEVARHWGPTARDQREAEKVAAAVPRMRRLSRQGRGPEKRARGQPKDQRHCARGRRSTPKARRPDGQTAELQKSGKSTSDMARIRRPFPRRLLQADARTLPRAPRRGSCAGCTREPAARSARYSGPRPTRRTATTSTST